MQHERDPNDRGWEHFEHGADVGIRGFGPTLDTAFEQAALALVATVTDPDSVRPTVAVHLTCEAPNLDILLVDWLNILLYEMATRHMLFGAFSVRIRGTRLDATAHGEPVDLARHDPRVEVKGATFTTLRVADEDGRWIVQCVIDV